VSDFQEPLGREAFERLVDKNGRLNWKRQKGLPYRKPGGWNVGLQRAENWKFSSADCCSGTSIHGFLTADISPQVVEAKNSNRETENVTVLPMS
jgi:hypothetical protein